MALDALLFDIDGTLLDTNSAHVEAWRRTFAAYGYRVGRDRIECEIGKGGDKLVPSILGAEADERDGESMRRMQPKEFAAIAASGLKPFAGAVELLKEVRRRSIKVVLATSSNKEHLAVLQQDSGVDLEGACDVLVTADDAAESKPAPDIVEAAVRKLKMSPAQCAMVGDTLYDMQAAKHAGVIGLGVQTGFQSRQSLLRHGARAVFSEASELLAKLDEALHLASPTAIRLTSAVLEELMRAALCEAERGLEVGEAPIGCVLADGTGHIIAASHNQINRSGDRTAHAEMMTLRNAAGKLPEDKRDFILVSTLEPCVMCTGAAMAAAIDTLAYGLQAPADSGTGRVLAPESPESQMPRIVGRILAQESRALFQRFAGLATRPLQRAFTEQLLSLT